MSQNNIKDERRRPNENNSGGNIVKKQYTEKGSGKQQTLTEGK